MKTEADVSAISLEMLGRGAVQQKFERALAEVAANIDDPSTGQDSRTITIKVTLKPNKSRTALGVAVGVSTKLAATEKVETTLFLGRPGGRLTVAEHDPDQLTVPGTEAGRSHREIQ